MAWIESHQTIGTHPKTRKAARLLGVSVPTVVGHLHLLWHWALDYAEDGDLTGYEAIDIATAALWEGDPDAFVTAFTECGPAGKHGFLEHVDGRLVIHDWPDYTGKLIERRRADADRKRTARSVRETSGGCPVDGEKTAYVTVPNRTVPNGVTNVTPSRRAVGATKDEPKEQDAIFEALIAGCYGKPAHELTADERGRANRAVKALRSLPRAPTGDEVEQRIAVYRQKFPKVEFTPQAISGNWSKLEPGQARPAHYYPTADELRAKYEQDVAVYPTADDLRQSYRNGTTPGGTA